MSSRREMSRDADVHVRLTKDELKAFKAIQRGVPDLTLSAIVRICARAGLGLVGTDPANILSLGQKTAKASS